LRAQAIGSQEKKLKPLFTSGSGQKRTQGKSLWNLEGMKYFHRAETKWRQVYDSKKDMRVLCNGWERWITMEMVQRRHSKQLWEHGVKIVHKLHRWGRSRMMERHRDLNAGIHWKGT
jgi:hypothetical protein